MSVFSEKTNEYVMIADARIKEYMNVSGIPEVLRRAMDYSISAGGKRLRPCLTLAACDMIGGSRAAALPLACAMEMIHTYSLIHDDMPCMDNDDYRRGKPSNHKMFGETFALLAGDGLLSYAFEIMLNAARTYCEKVPTYTDAMYAIAEGSGVRGMVAGQVADLSSNDVACDAANADKLAYIHTHKTGALIKASLLAGIYTGNAKATEITAIVKFGEAYGLLFQITDDILDVEGDFKGMGKTLGKDAAQQKLTYVNLYGLDKAKIVAKNTADEAKCALEQFAEAAEYLRELTDNTLNRKK
ncbi:MAG: polyprenyl synthetase family protein [Clostridia bacterium]